MALIVKKQIINAQRTRNECFLYLVDILKDWGKRLRNSEVSNPNAENYCHGESSFLYKCPMQFSNTIQKGVACFLSNRDPDCVSDTDSVYWKTKSLEKSFEVPPSRDVFCDNTG